MQINVSQNFDSEEAANEFRDAYLESYPPAGYGTMLSVARDRIEESLWHVTGSRSSSCD